MAGPAPFTHLDRFRVATHGGDAHFIVGQGVPGGDGHYQDEAPKGSIYLRSDDGQEYIKEQDGTGPEVWSRVQTQTDQDALLWVLHYRRTTTAPAGASTVVGDLNILEGRRVRWEITATATANPGELWGATVTAAHDGHTDTPATSADDWSIFDLQLSGGAARNAVDITMELTGTGQDQALQLIATPGGESWQIVSIRTIIS